MLCVPHGPGVSTILVWAYSGARVVILYLMCRYPLRGSGGDTGMVIGAGKTGRRGGRGRLGDRRLLRLDAIVVILSRSLGVP
jgi:hypothetical protein